MPPQDPTEQFSPFDEAATSINYIDVVGDYARDHLVPAVSVISTAVRFLPHVFFVGSLLDHESEEQQQQEHQEQQEDLIIFDPSEEDPVEALRHSENEPERSAAIQLQALRAGDHAEQADGRALEEMLGGTSEERQFAINILNRLSVPDLHRILELRNSHPQASEQLRELLNESGFFVPPAERILELLRGTNDQQSLGRFVIDELNAGGDRGQIMRHMVERGFSEEVLNQYSQLEGQTLNRVRDMFRTAVPDQEQDSPDQVAAHQLLRMLASDTMRRDGETLLEMLGGSDRRDARTILQVENDTDRETLLSMRGTAGSPYATILEMLRGDATSQRAASNLLAITGLENPTASDRQDLTTLTTMLANPNQRRLAERILAHQDPDQRHQLATLAARSQTVAVDNLLTILTSDNARTSNGATLLLHSLGEGENRQGRLSIEEADGLIDMLNSAGRESGLAQRAMRASNGDPAMLGQLTQLLQRTNESGEPDRAAAEALLSLTEGNRADRASAEYLLEMRSTGQDNTRHADYLLGLLTNGESGRRQLSAILNLADPAVHAILELPKPQQQLLLGLLIPRNGATPDADDPLGRQSDRVRAGAADYLLTSISSAPESGLPQGAQARDANRLLEMLGSNNAEHAGHAALILQHLTLSPRAINNMLAMIPENRVSSAQAAPVTTESTGECDVEEAPAPLPAEAQRLLDMLGGPTEQRSRATRILDGIEDPREVRHLMRMLHSEAEQPTADRIVDLLGRSPVQAQRIVSLMAGEQTSDRDAGMNALELVTRRPSNPRQNSESLDTENILGVAENNEQVRGLMRLRNEYPQTFANIIGLLNTSMDDDPKINNAIRAARNFATLMARGDADTLRLARWYNDPDHNSVEDQRLVTNLMLGNNDSNNTRLIDALCSDNSSRMRTALGALNTPEEINGLTTLLADPARTTAADTIMSMLNGNTDRQRGAANILAWIDSRRESPALTALLDRLEDPLTNQQTERQLSLTANTTQLIQLQRIPEGPARQQLLEMLTSRNEGQVQGARNFLQLASEDYEGPNPQRNRPATLSTRLLSMLENGSTRSETMSLIESARTSPRELRLLAGLIVPGEDGTPNPGLETGRWLLNSLSSTDRSSVSTAAAILDRVFDPEEVAPLVSLMRSNDETRRDWGRLVLQMLSDDDNNGRPRARRLLGLLAEPTTRARGEDVLRLLNVYDYEQNEMGRNVLDATNLRNDELGELARIATNQNYRTAASLLVDMSSDTEDRDRRATAQTLMMLLTDPSTRAEGQRLLDMLNNTWSQPTALRQLERQRQSSRRPLGTFQST